MLIYHVTIKIDRSLAQEWLDWMQTVHIPEVMQSGCFQSHRLAKMQSADDEEDGVTFSVQYLCPDQSTLDHYLKVHAPGLQLSHTNRYQGHFVAYRTVHEVISGQF